MLSALLHRESTRTIEMVFLIWILSAMLRAFFVLTLPFLLFACAWTTQTALQEVTFETPGALDAECDVMAGNTKYAVHPPETVTLPKGVEMLRVDCLAPGGRKKSYEYLPKISPMIVADGALGMAPGIAWDHYSGALYYYPEKIEIDFRGVPTVPETLPNYQNPDTRRPLLSGLEEVTPGMPGLNSDPVVPPRLERRAHETPSESAAPSVGKSQDMEGVLNRSISASPSPPGTTTGDLTRQYNPQVFGSGDGTAPQSLKKP